jgi:hypothetical protein
VSNVKISKFDVMMRERDALTLYPTDIKAKLAVLLSTILFYLMRWDAFNGFWG